MLEHAMRLYGDGENLREQGALAQALKAFRQVLNEIGEPPSPIVDAYAYDLFSMRALAARRAAEILIAQHAETPPIYDAIDIERHALETQLRFPRGQESLYSTLKAFMASCDAGDENSTRDAAVGLLERVFGVAGPAALHKARVALIRNYICHASVVFEREEDVADASGIAEQALSEALAFASDGIVTSNFQTILDLTREILDLMVRLNGDIPSWLARARVARSLLPTPPSPWSMGLISESGIAVLVGGIGKPHDLKWLFGENDPMPPDLS